MQIVIPMSGIGERFQRVGYTIPKPLIEVEGKPIIAHVAEMFPGEHDFTFICNENHLANREFAMGSILREIEPGCRIVKIPEHKRGPIHAVQQALPFLDLDRPVVVNYADFTCWWNWAEFKELANVTAAEGIVPAYRGFHPHSLGTTNYAYLKTVGNRVIDIREKQSFTKNRMNEYASSGTYYFRTAGMMAEAFSQTVERGLEIGGEYYVSLAYLHLLRENLLVEAFPLEHFVQWGTPEDLDEYKMWSRAFREITTLESDQKKEPTGAAVIPMAGLGQRFKDEEITTPKPLIEVSGRPMFLQSALQLPHAAEQAFVVRQDMVDISSLNQMVEGYFSSAKIVALPSLPEGQAISALAGINALQPPEDSRIWPITVATADSTAIYDRLALDKIIEEEQPDIIVWGYRGYPNATRNPEMYGWVEEKEGEITGVSVKRPLSDPSSDPVIIGVFTFRNVDVYKESLEALRSRNERVNGEYYIDSFLNDAIMAGNRCRLFEVNSYLNWGTPDDLRTFEYWQSFFTKWPSHPYSLEGDPMIPSQALPEVRAKYNLTE